MITSETVFVDGVPVGRIVIDTNSQQIAFLPATTTSKLPERDWVSLEELRNAIAAAYQDSGKGGNKSKRISGPDQAKETKSFVCRAGTG